MKLPTTFTAPCFSNQCGFCSSCCDSEYDCDESQSILRAKDLVKFMGSKKINEEIEFYEKKLNNFVENTNYCNPSDIGFTKKKN